MHVFLLLLNYELEACYLMLNLCQNLGYTWSCRHRKIRVFQLACAATVLYFWLDKNRFLKKNVSIAISEAMNHI